MNNIETHTIQNTCDSTDNFKIRSFVRRLRLSVEDKAKIDYTGKFTDICDYVVSMSDLNEEIERLLKEMGCK